MTAIFQDGFTGEQPAASKRSRNLTDNRANSARNMSLYDGRIVPLRATSFVYETANGQTISTLYHYSSGLTTTWMTWDKVVDVALSPIPQDSLGRFYWTGAGEPRMSTLAAAVSGVGPYPAAWWVLGVWAPETAPTITPPSGGTTQNRSYVYTKRTQFGEESEPSPAGTGAGDSVGTWTISGLDQDPVNSSGITSITSASGVVTINTTSTRGLEVGETVSFSGTGIAALNGNEFEVASILSATAYTILSGTPVSGGAAGTWTRVAPHNTTGMVTRIYRTVATSPEFHLVAELASGVTSYNDSKTDAQVLATGITLSSQLTNTPPKDLHSLIALPNGSFAGLSKNQFCLSEPNKPHSWPIDYRYTFAATGVALAAAGNSVVILTDQTPLLATFSTPAAVSITKMEEDAFAPCVSKPGVVEAMGGAIFPSHDGMTLASPSVGVRNLSIPSENAAIFRREQWQALNPETIVAAFYDREYLLAHTTNAVTEMVAINPSGPWMVRRFDQGPAAMHVSRVDKALYIADGSRVYKWAGDSVLSQFAYWESKDYQLDQPTTWNVFQVHAAWDEVPEADATLISRNINLMTTASGPGGSIGGAPIGAVPVGGTYLFQISSSVEPSLTIGLYGDGKLLDTLTLKDSKIRKFRAGYKSYVTKVVIQSNVPVISWSIAETVDELRRIP